MKIISYFIDFILHLFAARDSQVVKYDILCFQEIINSHNRFFALQFHP
jgi:hypothetical protein